MKSNEIPEALPGAITLIEDKVLAKLPDSDLAKMIAHANTQLRECVGLIVKSERRALCYAIALGQIFDAAFRRHRGEFGFWLSGVTDISHDTALNYRVLYNKREMLFPPDGSEPLARTINEALIKVGARRAPEQSEGNALPSPLFRYTLRIASTPMEEWPRPELQNFLRSTEAIIEARARAAQLLGTQLIEA